MNKILRLALFLEQLGKSPCSFVPNGTGGTYSNRHALQPILNHDTLAFLPIVAGCEEQDVCRLRSTHFRP